MSIARRELRLFSALKALQECNGVFISIFGKLVVQTLWVVNETIGGLVAIVQCQEFPVLSKIFSVICERDAILKGWLSAEANRFVTNASEMRECLSIRARLSGTKFFNLMFVGA